MNINQNYGDMPSEIQDSFEQSIIDNDQSINLDSSIEDTFLDNFDLHHLQHQQSPQSLSPSLSLSKYEVKANLLPGQTQSEVIQLINPSPKPMVISFTSPFEISTPFSKFNEEIELSGWQRTQLHIKIQQLQNQYGNIYETIIGEYWWKEDKKKHKTYIKVEVNFIVPKLKLKYSGCSDVINVRGNKVSMNRIGKNKQGQYCIEFSMSGMERFQCKIQSFGDCTLIPKGLTLYNEEMRKITLRKGENRVGAIAIRVLNAKVNYVMGIQFI